MVVVDVFVPESVVVIAAVVVVGLMSYWLEGKRERAPFLSPSPYLSPSPFPSPSQKHSAAGGVERGALFPSPVSILPASPGRHNPSPPWRHT